MPLFIIVQYYFYILPKPFLNAFYNLYQIIVFHKHKRVNSNHFCDKLKVFDIRYIYIKMHYIPKMYFLLVNASRGKKRDDN